MAGKTQDMVIEVQAINYARIASPVAKYETNGSHPTQLEWKADFLIDEDTVDAIQARYPNLRKKMNPITPKKYLQQYKVEMPEGVEGPSILKLTQDVAVEYKDKKTGEQKLLEKPQPKALLSQGEGKAKDITFEFYIGNGSKGKVQLKHRVTAYNNKPIDVIELGSIMITHLVEVDAKPGQGSGEDNVADVFGLDEVEESEAQAPPRNEKGLAAQDNPPFDQDIDDDFAEEDDVF